MASSRLLHGFICADLDCFQPERINYDRADQYGQLPGLNRQCVPAWAPWSIARSDSVTINRSGARRPGGPCRTSSPDQQRLVRPQNRSAFNMLRNMALGLLDPLAWALTLNPAKSATSRPFFVHVAALSSRRQLPAGVSPMNSFIVSIHPCQFPGLLKGHFQSYRSPFPHR